MANRNIQKLTELFPNVITEAYGENNKIVKSVDFNLLKEVLGVNECGEENYSFTWAGKAKAINTAYQPAKKKLIECKEKSLNYGQTANMYIEGDNLEALKLLLPTHSELVDVIYIDPPYNTGREFTYNDNFYGLHSAWCSMIYPRLLLSRELLSPDGVIFISIDDNELDNLKKMMDEVYGEKHFIARFIWIKTNTPPSLSKKVRRTAEYILCYEKSNTGKRLYGEPLDNCDAPLLNTSNPEKILAFPSNSIRFTYPCENIIKKGVYPKLEILDDIVVLDGTNTNPVRLKGHFKWSQPKLNSEIENGVYFLVKSNLMSIRFQRLTSERFKPPTSILLDKETGVSTNEAAVKELSLLGLEGAFDFPKPVSLIKKLLNMHTYNKKDAVVLDFFSGSATTAHAVMELNAEDNGSRSFIMVQENVECGNDTGFTDICEIGRERIYRAGVNLKDKQKNTESLDTGFRVFYLS